MRFWRYTGRRLAFLPVQLLIVSAIVFFLVRLLPGDPSYLLAGPFATVERVDEVRRRLGLDQPVYVQYVRYLRSVVRGEFGTSWITSQSVLQDIGQRLPATMELILAAMVLSVLVGIPLGVWTAVRKTGIADRAVFALRDAGGGAARLLVRPHHDLRLLLPARLGPRPHRPARSRSVEHSAPRHRHVRRRRVPSRRLAGVPVGACPPGPAGDDADRHLHAARS